MREHESGPPCDHVTWEANYIYTKHEERLISLDLVLSRSKAPSHYLVILEVFLI